jgi:predicted transcriptional regulator
LIDVGESSLKAIYEFVEDPIKRVINNLQTELVDNKYVTSFVKKRLSAYNEGKKESQFWINHLKNIYLYNEPVDNIDKYENIYKSINQEIIKDMANKYLNLDEIFYTELNPKGK